MGHYVADEIKLEAQATSDISIQLHNLLKYIYVCNKTQTLICQYMLRLQYVKQKGTWTIMRQVT